MKSRLGEDEGVLANMTAFCCCTVFFPVGIMVPLYVVGPETLSWKVLGSLQTVATAVMLFVTLFTMTLNIRLERNTYERNAKVAIHALRQALRTHRIVMDPLVGRSIYDTFTQRLNTETSRLREWLLFDDAEPHIDEALRVGLFKVGGGKEIMSNTHTQRDHRV